MNIREWIMPLVLALATTWFIQRFVLSRFFGTTSVAETADFIAPEEARSYKPLNTEIDYIDNEAVQKETVSVVDTNWGTIVLSSHGAAIQSIDFELDEYNNNRSVRTVFPPSTAEREAQCFLLALNEPTPYFYTLQDQHDAKDAKVLTYRASFSQGVIFKTYTIYTHKHQIDVSCEVQLNVALEKPLEMRLMYPSPFMVDIADRDVVSSVVINNTDTFERTSRTQLDIRKGWYKPHMFGSEDSYFVHALINDQDNFVQRAYYKFSDKNTLTSVLEGPDITESKKWNLSFYFGPKQQYAIDAVDNKLEQTLGYSGFFAAVAKLFLKTLRFLYSYVKNWGVAIIVLTILIKLVFLPLTIRGDARIKQQQKMAQEMNYLKQRYKDNPQALAAAQAELIKKYGLPGAGCLPMLLQIPIFIAMRSMLAGAVELYKAPFLWIPDLSAADPYYVLPFLFVVSMWIQAIYADQQQRMILVGLGVVFGAVMANFSAGLALYFVLHGVLTVIQNKLVALFKRS